MSRKHPEKPSVSHTCPVCGPIGAGASAMRKQGWPEDDTWLPAAVLDLETVHTMSDTGSRKRELLRCPACGDQFLYVLDYEFLANGSEDFESLVRITAKEAEEHRRGR